MLTKDQTELKHVGQDIELFLRLAAVRIAEHPDVLPFKPANGQLVIGWLRALTTRYANGEDITA